MNVKEGDLAIVTVAHGRSDELGKIVKVLHPDPVHIQKGPAWVVESTSPGIGCYGQRYEAGRIGWVWDSFLRPISGLPDAEDTITEKEKENETS